MGRFSQEVEGYGQQGEGQIEAGRLCKNTWWEFLSIVQRRDNEILTHRWQDGLIEDRYKISANIVENKR